MLGKETFNLTKKDYSEKLSRIINNHPVNSRIIGASREFVLRSCKLVHTWEKMARNPEVHVYLRNIDIAGGRKVKVLYLEQGGSKQPVPKNKLIDSLYPPKKSRTTASLEDKHYNMVKSSMRFAVNDQLKNFRSQVKLPTVCYLTGKELRRGSKTDVDHVGMSFSEIADSFLIEKGLSFTDISLEGPPTAKKFRDKTLWEEWQEYHRRKAVFSIVCSSANRSKGSGQYQTPRSLYGSFSKQDPEDLSLDF